jgi:hypothetical protein
MESGDSKFTFAVITIGVITTALAAWAIFLT